MISTSVPNFNFTGNAVFLLPLRHFHRTRYLWSVLLNLFCFVEVTCSGAKLASHVNILFSELYILVKCSSMITVKETEMFPSEVVTRQWSPWVTTQLKRWLNPACLRVAGVKDVLVSCSSGRWTVFVNNEWHFFELFDVAGCTCLILFWSGFAVSGSGCYDSEIT